MGLQGRASAPHYVQKLSSFENMRLFPGHVSLLQSHLEKVILRDAYEPVSFGI